MKSKINKKLIWRIIITFAVTVAVMLLSVQAAKSTYQGVSTCPAAGYPLNFVSYTNGCIPTYHWFSLIFDFVLIYTVVFITLSILAYFFPKKNAQTKTRTKVFWLAILESITGFTWLFAAFLLLNPKNLGWSFLLLPAIGLALTITCYYVFLRWKIRTQLNLFYDISQKVVFMFIFVLITNLVLYVGLLAVKYLRLSLLDPRNTFVELSSIVTFLVVIVFLAIEGVSYLKHHKPPQL